MKIAYTINSTYNSGGMERVLMTKSNYLSDIAGHEVTIITSQQHNKTNFFPFSKRIKFHDLNINYDDSKGNPILKTLIKWKKRIIHKRLLTKYLNKIRPDICISMFDYDFTFLYQIKDGSKKILEFHFCKKQKVIESPNAIMKILQAIRIWSWRKKIKKYERFIVLTEEDRKYWGNFNNIMVIKNPLLKIPNTKAKFDSKRVLSIGRISYQKGFDRLIQVWGIVSPNFPDWELHIVGGGDFSELKRQIQDLNIENNVKIKPATDKIEDEYINSSIYTMTSRYEGLPMVLLEAMSYGIPVISFSCPCGPKDLIQPEYGSLVQEGDIKGFASALMSWMENEEKRKIGGQKAKEYVKQYTQDKIMKQWLNLFENLIK